MPFLGTFSVRGLYSSEVRSNWLQSTAYRLSACEAATSSLEVWLQVLDSWDAMADSKATLGNTTRARVRLGMCLAWILSPLLCYDAEAAGVTWMVELMPAHS